MKRIHIEHIAFLLFALLGSPSVAQVMLPSAQISRGEMLIGQQAEITLSLELAFQDQWPAVDFPYHQDELVTGLEILQTHPVDTVQPDPANERLFQLSQRYLVTSFDSGHYNIGRLAIVVNGDSLFSNPLQLAVNTVQVDTTQTAIFDIKDIYDVELTWRDYFDLYGWIILLLLLAGGLIVIAVYFYRKKKQQALMVEETPEPAIPPHVVALEALGKIEDEKSWKNSDLKKYHTELTDILREYIEQRFRVPAQEQTTNEIMQSLRFADFSEDAALRLRHVLKLADMVKFAKEVPAENENHRSFNLAKEFVEMTIPVPESENAPHPEEENSDA